MGKVMRHTLGASLNIRHNLSSSKGPKPLQLKLLTTYIPKTSAFTLAFSTSQRLRTTRASARNFFSDKLVLTSVTPASSAPVLQTPKATSSTLYFDSLTVNAGNGGFLHCIQMDTSVNAAN